MTALYQIFALCKKEFLALFKNPASRTMLIVPALLQALLFGYGATYDLTNVPYALLDQSRSAASVELMSKLDGTGVFHRIANLSSAKEIAPVIDNNQALMVVSIPADFESKLNSGENAPLQVILDGRNSSTAGSAGAYMANIVADFNQKNQGSPAISLEKRVWYNPNLESRWMMMPSLIATLSLIQTLMLAALSVAREREQGTFDQLLVTPLTPMQILIGKAVPSIAIGIMQSTLIFLIIRFWFGIPMNGSLWVLYLGLLMFTVSAVGIGLSISAFATTMQQAMLFTFVIIMPLNLLSGQLTAVRNMPEVLQIATYANPLRFGIDTVRRVYLEGAGFADVAVNFIPLLIIAAISLPMAAWLFRNRLA